MTARDRYYAVLSVPLPEGAAIGLLDEATEEGIRAALRGAAGTEFDGTGSGFGNRDFYAVTADPPAVARAVAGALAGGGTLSFRPLAAVEGDADGAELLPRPDPPAAAPPPSPTPPGVLVRWLIDLDPADPDVRSPEDCARAAWAHMRARGSIANVFEVVWNGRTYTVDLDHLDALREASDREDLAAQFDLAAYLREIGDPDQLHLEAEALRWRGAPRSLDDEALTDQ
jgi:hypothetical protein